ncbi:MucB/RseB C-terminal domain-containing protein [Undibacterium sp. LX40W]|uniref:MucB/RseB C-terminal domain-containing protein n=1 Tax=Undibacterium nitidum TaxID=2762298 RepID=A0A923KJV8_9BURK|nr:MULTISPECIES: MucB/RseB C-terminal domain-containing protein [Undibacterium]MBC3880080.1 MucB/RseB C-terminal domain-containing protein [Undibacterium nitidum]MBC3891184.1 MucB/RseB C-terminal domain-containing protein [Undibacterium sp. LX40W]
MFQRLVYRLGVFFLSGILPLVAFAQSNPDDAEMGKLLQSIQSAARKLSYSGTFVYQQGNQIRTSRITHGYDGDVEVEKLEILDGKPREYVRRNGEVNCYLPESKTIQVEKNLTQEEFPALLNESANLLPQSYLIRKAQMSRVAGAECQVLSLQPKDSSRYGFKLCVEKNTNLLLGIQTLNPRQEVIEQIAFTQVSIGDIDKSRLKPSYSGIANWKTEYLTVKANVNSGWSVKSLPAGYKKTLETRRLIPMSASAAGNDSNVVKSHEVVQMMFSDGLSTFSVFIEPNLGNRTEGSLQQGAMTITSKRLGEHWLTVVGEVPSAAIKQVVSSIQFKK